MVNVVKACNRRLGDRRFFRGEVVGSTVEMLMMFSLMHVSAHQLPLLCLIRQLTDRIRVDLFAYGLDVILRVGIEISIHATFTGRLSTT